MPQGEACTASTCVARTSCLDPMAPAPCASPRSASLCCAAPLSPYRYPFSSRLKRMTVVASVNKQHSQSSSIGTDASANTSASTGALWVFSKGAPEVIATLLSAVPALYHETYRHHMNQGKRVLALACRKLPKSLTGIHTCTLWNRLSAHP